MVYTTTCVGITVFSACRRSDCSGERCQVSPNRSLKYLAQNSQKEAYQGVLSPARAFGLEDISQPLITSRRNPFRRSLSRCVRVSSFDRNTRRPFVWRVRSAVRDSASFSFGFGILCLAGTVHKHVAPCKYKHITSRKYKQIELCAYKRKASNPPATWAAFSRGKRAEVAGSVWVR